MVNVAFTGSFDSAPGHQFYEPIRVMGFLFTHCGNSSVGRAIPCQGIGREFEPLFPLHMAHIDPSPSIAMGFLLSCFKSIGRSRRGSSAGSVHGPGLQIHRAPALWKN